MYTQTREVWRQAQPHIFDTVKTDQSAYPDPTDLQRDYLDHQRQLLKELRIQDKTHALHDPAQYLKFLTWQVVERSFDRLVWTEPHPTHDGKGYSTSARCAVFRTNNAGAMEPTFLAKVSYRSQTDAAGNVLLDARGNPMLEPDAHIIETDLQGLKRGDGHLYRFSQSEYRTGVQAEVFERMGRAVLLDELDTMRYIDTLGNDVLTVVRNFDHMDDHQRAVQDRLARTATEQLIYHSTDV